MILKAFGNIQQNNGLSHKPTFISMGSQSFKTIASTSLIARERTEFAPPIHIHPHDRHLIIYAILDDHIAILRLLGGQQDWQAVLQKMDS
ncbi:MAG: toxin ParE1/3/4 [Maritalea sp.]|jgi:toxin ParE1/3/4